MSQNKIEKYLCPWPEFRMKKWLREAEEAGIFNDYEEWDLHEDEIKHEYAEETGMEPEGREFESFVDYKFHQKGAEYYQKRCESFAAEFEEKADCGESGITLYRHLIVEDPAEFVKSLKGAGYGHPSRQGLGDCWSWSREAAFSHCAEIEGREVLLKARVPWGSVLKMDSFFFNINPYLKEEAEIRLKKGAPLFLVSVESDGEIFEINSDSLA